MPRKPDPAAAYGPAAKDWQADISSPSPPFGGAAVDWFRFIPCAYCGLLHRFSRMPGFTVVCDLVCLCGHESDLRGRVNALRIEEEK